MRWLVLGVVFVSLFLANSAYAFSFDDVFSWFSNAFGEITGYVSYEGESTATPTPEPTASASPEDTAVPAISSPLPPTAESSPAPAVTASPAPSIAIINDQVKCLFTGSNSVQECISSSNSMDGMVLRSFYCSGVGSCDVVVAGWQNAQLTWKSTCGGYAYTVIDGKPDYAEFNCAPSAAIPIEQSALATPAAASPAYTSPGAKEQVKCLFVNSASPQKCYTAGGPWFACSGTGSCTAGVYGETGMKVPWTSSCGGNAYTVIDGVDEYAEFNCAQAVVQLPTQQETPVAVSPLPATTPISEKERMVKEQVSCIFWNSNVLQNPHTSSEKCFTGDGRFSCVWDGQVNEEKIDGNTVRYPVCVAGVSGKIGEKIEWKSSCGGLAYTVLDGNNEKAEFKCVSNEAVTTAQVQAKGFTRASWTCYDGTVETLTVGSSVECWSYEKWKANAEEQCKSRCSDYADAGVTKCGVNSLSVIAECYPDLEKQNVLVPQAEAEQAKPSGAKKIAMPPNAKKGDAILVYFYADSCRFCDGMGERMDAVSRQLNVQVIKSDVAQDKTLANGYVITALPTIVLLIYDPTAGIVEYKKEGKAGVIETIEWVNAIRTKYAGGQVPEQALETPTVEVKQPLLICKDSCPSVEEGKCYPFGYRLKGEFCSGDKGAFEAQLDGGSACENNFECSTNVCVNSKCVSPTLIEKIFEWFQNLFGFG